MCKQVVDRAALGRKRGAERVVRNRVEHVEVDAIMNRPGLEQLFFHVESATALRAVMQPADRRLIVNWIECLGKHRSSVEDMHS